MEAIKLIIGYTVCVVVGLLALLVIWKIIRGDINLDLLISEKTGEASMSRFQLLVFSFIVGLSFFFIVMTSKSLPDVPGGVLGLLGISASSYTVSKAIQANMPQIPPGVERKVNIAAKDTQSQVADGQQ
jgi:hypothetical protein